MSERMTPLRDRDTVLILHDGWGRAAAVDAETRLSEAGLAGTQLADYRNFAHGRHNWLDKNRDRTGIIAFVTPGCDRLAARTLCLIPDTDTDLWWLGTRGMRLDGSIYWETMCTRQLKAWHTRETRR